MTDVTTIGDGGELAQELGRAYSGVLEDLMVKHGLAPAEAVAATDRAGLMQARAIAERPTQASWFALSVIAKKNPALVTEILGEMDGIARRELASGKRAAAMLGPNATPMDRAQFMAMRSALMTEWQPRNGMERILIDQLAQLQSLYELWMTRLFMRSATEAALDQVDLREHSGWKPTHLDSAQAIEQCAAMIDRINRMMLRTERALRDQRRQAPPTVVVQNAGQVNMAGQQVVQQGLAE